MLSSNEASDTSNVLSEKEAEKAKEQQEPSPLERLLPQQDPLFKKAVEQFLLLDPERTISQLGDVDSLVKQAEESKSKGNNTMARIYFESAAKISIYRQNKEDTRRYLLEADEVTEKQVDHDIHQKLLDNIDEVLRVSREYQRTPHDIPHEADKEPPKDDNVVVEPSTTGLIHPP